MLTAEAQSLDVKKMSPLGDRVLVQPVEESATTAGGLVMTATATKQMHDATIGTVVAVGDEVKVKVANGDTVLFSKYGTSDVAVPDGDVCFVQEKSILAKLS